MKKSIKILLIALGVPLLILIGAVIFYCSVTAGVKLDLSKLTLNQTTVEIFDRHGDPVEKESAGEIVPFDELPKSAPLAFVAVEDKRFYEHNGLDYKRIAKAALINLKSFSFREGASTISQQLIKNTHLSNEKTLTRKLKEMKLTRQMEKTLSKDEILELYLNTIYFGHSAFGIENAANFYFGHSARELLPAESATLAALVKSPNRYSPFQDPEKCLSRRNFVLKLMKEQQILSEEEYKTAKQVPLPTEPTLSKKRSFYLTYVFEELSEIFPDFRSGDSLRVYTYLDKNLQETLEREETTSDVIRLVRGNADNSIKAIHSTCGIPKRLPASTIKPLAVYAPAIEEDLLSPATPILDEKISFSDYSPKNYSGNYEGYMSARYALSRSVNVPAVKVLNSLGIDKAAKYLEKMGLSIPEEDKTLALALGGMKEGFSLPALADAYSVFAREGAFSSSSTIAKVENKAGELLYDRRTLSATKNGEGENKVFSEETCVLINDMLKTAAKEGTARKLKSLPFSVCAKTGTAGNDRGNTDAYTIAYTYEDVVAVWLGNRDNSPIQETGGGAAANETLRILKALYKEHSPEEFPASENVVTVALDREEYEENHRLLVMDPTAPDYLALHELFKKSAIPEGTSTKFHAPKIQKPLISVKNGAVEIILCQTYYYDYEVKRESEGQISVIYRGSYRKNIVDNSVQGGKRYTYTITPFYQGIEGESITLPSVFVESKEELPDDWWETYNLNSSLDFNASSINSFTGSLFSSSSTKRRFGLIAGKSGRKTVQQSSNG